MGTFLYSLDRTSNTLAILLSALKPIVKKLFSIEIVIFNTFALSEAYWRNIGHRKMLEQT
jgi:hypothetical protein